LRQNLSTGRSEGGDEVKVGEMPVKLRGRILTFATKSRKKCRPYLVYLNNHLISRLPSRVVRMSWYRYVMGYAIGEGASILPDFRVSRPSNLVIGCHTVINNSCRFDNRRKITIGNNVSISYGTTILTLGHDIDSPDFALKGGDVVVEDYVWLCAYSLVVPGVRLKTGAVALAGSVVTADVEEFTVVGGNPAKVLRERSRDLRYTLHWSPRMPDMLG